jgi:dolichyl-diphosphooligosaccharide--protein glycosyltransferase
VSEEITLDIAKLKEIKGKMGPFFKTHGIILLVLIPIILSAWIRLIPSGLPATDDWAKATVDNFYKNSIRDQVRQQYPNLPEQNINGLVEQNYAQYVKQNKAQIEQQTKQVSQQYKDHFQDENGYTYMPDIDPYHYLRYSRNLLEKGQLGDEVRNGEQWDNHFLAPKGNIIGPQPHSIVLATLHRILKVFGSKTLTNSATYFPVIFIALAVIPVFFIGRMLAGNIGGLFAGIVFAVNGALLGRTTWGHADTDPYNVLFPLYFIWLFFLALNSQNTKKALTYASLSGLTLGIFSIFWGGWWYAFDFVLGTIVLYAVYQFIAEHKLSIKSIKESREIKRYLITVLTIIISSAIFVSIFTSPKNFVTSSLGPISFVSIKEASHANLWPNVYTTVAELNEASFDSIISSVGGRLFFYLSLLGILFLLLKKTDNKRDYVPYAILIILWYIGIIYASTKGIRFTMMLVPPLALAIGAAIGIIYKKAVQYMQKMEISPKITGTVVIILFILIFMPYIKGASASVKSEIPIINDAWFNSLNKIKQESAPNAIINSWWDFGHHFKFFADRAVTFDGASQNTPMAHWIGKVLLTNNEKEAIGILRMLDCGSNDAFETLNKEVNDSPTSVKLLYDIIVMDKFQAQSHLSSQGINKETASKVTELTHCTPPENYFITSEDMVSKSAVWAHFGSWDFNKADIWINTRNLPREEAIEQIQKRLNVNEEEAKKVYFQVKGITNDRDANAWIAPWPGYSGVNDCQKQDMTLACGGFLIDLETKEAQVSTDKGWQTPYSITYEENGEFFEKKFENGLLISILLLKSGDSYRIVQASPEIAGSMFTRLFFYDGIGTKQFLKFSDETSLGGQRIIVWKVRW